MAEAGADEAKGFEVYVDFVQEQLTVEEARKASLEQRGIAVITSSGVLATLGFGALALAKRGDHIPLPAAGPPLLVIGACALFAAAVLALATNAPLRHRAVNPVALKERLRNQVNDDRRVALVRVTATRLGLLDTTRRGNNVKALLCIAAMVAEVLGVTLLGTTIYLVLVG